MKTFTDTAGRTWTIRLDLGSALAVKEQLNIDLLQIEAGEPPLLTRLGTDELLLGQVICCLLGNQFETHHVSESDVRTSFDGATLLAAQKAFYEELVDFFQSRGRSDRAKAVAAQAVMIEKAVGLASEKIDALDVDRMIDGAMSGGLPDNSASIPDP